MIDYKKICSETCNIARKAGDLIKQYVGNINANDISIKGQHDFVTFVDKGSEILIIDKLKKLLPGAGFIAEEGTESFKGETFNWIIDPLDGTSNFIHGLAPFAVSIALMQADEIVIGVVYEISLDECFYAYKGDCARLNGMKLNMSKSDKFEDTLIATGFPFRDYSQLENYMKALNFFILNTSGVRRLGSAATDLVYLAAGRFDGFFEYSLKPWDVAAGSFIIQRAGGVVTDFSGDNNYLFGGEIIASNAYLYQQMFNVIKNCNL